jgi:hypothetical protein
MVRSIRLLLLAATVVCVTPVRAHDAPPPAGCHAPVRPADEQNDLLWQVFLDDVDDFRQCISDFVQANQAAALVHNQAARQATEAWNGFVRSSLNVPEDFPWPPEEPEREPPQGLQE